MSEVGMVWHKVTKSYKGGSNDFQIAVPKGVRLTNSEWQDILEWLGENTSGGHAYGYSMKTRRLVRQSNKLRTVRYPSGLCAKLMDFGDLVVSTQKMI